MAKRVSMKFVPPRFPSRAPLLSPFRLNADWCSMRDVTLAPAPGPIGGGARGSARRGSRGAAGGGAAPCPGSSASTAARPRRAAASRGREGPGFPCRRARVVAAGRRAAEGRGTAARPRTNGATSTPRAWSGRPRRRGSWTRPVRGGSGPGGGERHTGLDVPRLQPSGHGGNGRVGPEGSAPAGGFVPERIAP